MGYGSDIRKARKRREWTQTDLAREMGASATTISNWETEKTKPGIDDVDRLCELLNIPKPDFLNSLGIVVERGPAGGIIPELLNFFRRMPEDQQEDLLRFLRKTARAGRR